MPDSTMIGKPRVRDMTGETLGAYEVVGPVGRDWRTSIYWILRCLKCGFERKVLRNNFCAYRNHVHCSACHARMCAKVVADQ